MKYFVLICLFVQVIPVSAQKVSIQREGESWKLVRNGMQLYIKGVVGEQFMDKVPAHGGNSIRTNANKRNLDKAHSLGLTALVNLPAAAERYGMDFNDWDSVQRLKAKVVGIVRELKDHPSVLMWTIGNELDYVPGSKPFNPKVWNAVNDIAKAIHEVDPDHPVMTVIGTSRIEKVADIVKLCPELDLLGLNTYGDIYTIGDTLRRYGWEKPYIISEWGPDGYWEVPKTPWKAPYEQTGREKLDCYKKKYREAILRDTANCLGSYVFYWSGDKQETTHTWFVLFDKKGTETPIVNLMQELWTGHRSEPAPVVDSVNIGKFVRYQPVYLKPSSKNTASVSVTLPEKLSANAKVSYKWEIRPEAVYASYAGQGEVEPQPLPGLTGKGASNISFVAPREPGAYRLFAYVYDNAGHFSSASLPFLVEE